MTKILHGRPKRSAAVLAFPAQRTALSLSGQNSIHVIASAQYQLLVNSANVFEIAKENGAEYVFSVQFDLSPHIGNITIQMQYPNESALAVVAERGHSRNPSISPNNPGF